MIKQKSFLKEFIIHTHIENGSPRIQVSKRHCFKQQICTFQTATSSIHLEQLCFYKLMAMKPSFKWVGMYLFPQTWAFTRFENWSICVWIHWFIKYGQVGILGRQRDVHGLVGWFRSMKGEASGSVKPVGSKWLWWWWWWVNDGFQRLGTHFAVAVKWQEKDVVGDWTEGIGMGFCFFYFLQFPHVCGFFGVMPTVYIFLNKFHNSK